MAINQQLGKAPSRAVSGRHYSYSGADFNIWAYYDKSEAVFTSREDRSNVIQVRLDDARQVENIAEVNRLSNTKKIPGESIGIMSIGNLQTITTSFASSVSSVEVIGSSLPQAHTRGQKTYAGSCIFTVLENEPLKKIIDSNYAVNNHDSDRRSSHFTIDQIPAFNIVLQGTNELPYKNGVPQSIMKVIVGIKFMTHGETISIDDFFLEQTYQYVSKYVTPWIQIDNTEKDSIEGIMTLQDLARTATSKNVISNKRDFI